jgi:hypothetical protein
MSFYGDLQKVTYDSIKPFGRFLVFTRPVVASVSVTGGTVTPGTALTTTGCSIVLPASKGTVEAFDNRLAEKEVAGRELRYLKVAAFGMTFIPKSLDKVTFDGKTWLVLGCTPINPAGVPLVYGIGVEAA